MKPPRRTASALALIVTLLGASTVASFHALYHPICIAHHHDCGEGPTLKTCCCGDEQSAQSDSTPSLARVEFGVDLTAVPVVLETVAIVLTPHVPFTIDASPPHRVALDLPTFFSSLLI